MSDLVFLNQSNHKRPQRSNPSKYSTSPIRRELEQGGDGGMRPVGAFYPWKSLPVQWQDVETDDWIVITKGTIVSLITNQVTTTAGTGISGGLPDIEASGSIPVFDDETVSGATYTALNIDTSYWGYHETAAGLLIPANGGSAVRYEYAADDVTAAVVHPDTDLTIVTAAEFADTPKNTPVGVVFMDIMQDIRGKSLNYNLYASQYGVLSDGLIVLPYIDYGDTTPQTTSTFAATKVLGANSAFDAVTADVGYNAVYKKHSFFYFDSAADPSVGARAGSLLQSDAYGKFVGQGTGESQSVTVARDQQTVGRLLYTDARYPKDQLQAVDTYPGSGLQGTETNGIPAFIYNFAVDALTGMSLATTSRHVLEMVKSGAIGAAYIQLDVS